MRVSRPDLRVASLLAAAAVMVVASTAALLSADGAEPIDIQIILAPHPDDELLAFPALEDDPSTYSVVVTLTRGEATNRCADAASHTQIDAGEILPDPLPEPGDKATCAQARLGAWAGLLREASAVIPTVRLGRFERVTISDDAWGGVGDFTVGANAAYVALSLPDGGVGVDQVVDALNALLSARGSVLPDLPVRRIVAAGYWNDADENGTSGAFEYEHPDHRALTVAMPTIAAMSGSEVWINVPPGEEDTVRAALGTEVGSIEKMSLSNDHYDALMGLGAVGDEGPARIGLYQQYYGWLAFPGDWWPAGDVVDDEILFARSQTYLVIDGDAR